MNHQFYFKDWSDVIWFLVGLLIAYLLYQVFLHCYKEHEKDEETRKMFLTDDERHNLKVMNSIEHDCQYDISEHN